MKTPVDEFTSVLERLSDKVAELEARLSALERRSAAMGYPSARPGSAPVVPPVPLAGVSLPRPPGALAAVGRVFLGIAGAYLLRALAESGILPRLAVVAVALAYAVAWLVWAGRARAATGFARAASAITAALILSPMLWELTLRFRTLPAWATAAVLAGFAVLAFALGWRRNLTAVVGLSTFAAASTGLVLQVATRDPAPFVLALLVMALVEEAAACRDRWLYLRPITAVAADLAALVLILVYTGAEGAPAEYTPLAAALLMALIAAGFVIYGATTVFRTVILRRRISVFEIVQPAVAFLLATAGILRLSHAAGTALGAFCLLAAAASYVAALTRMAHLPQARNYHVFATWGSALFLVGSFLLLPAPVRAFWLALAAVVAVFFGVRWVRTTIGFHGAVYMAAAGLVSGLFEYAGRALAGAPSGAPESRIWMTAVATLVGYAVAVHSSSAGSPSNADLWSTKLLRLAYAAPAAYVAAALAVVPAVWMESLVTPISPSLLAATRTLVLCLAALGLAFAGSRWKRIELVWLAYAAIAFCTLKLLFEDLRYGSAVSIAASLFFYGMAWVLVPRLGRKTQP